MAQDDPDRWQQVRDLFDAALERSPEERADFVAEAAGSDHDLRQEVESLLASDAESSALLDASAFPARWIPGDPDGEDWAAGQLVGAYRITERLGAGGMGSVYLAVRADAAYEKSVAIKVVKRGMDSAAIVRRFERERHTLARLEHPYIARLLDGGTAPDGRPYFVMEYVDGIPIDRYCDQEALSIDRRLRLFRKVCDAVAHAHRHLIVHSDIKPENVLITRDGVPKLVDFGIAKLLDPGAADPATVTAPGAGRPMTIRYASPEQIAGAPIATATDVYSLGVLLYELLAGRSPYRVDTASRLDLERAVLEQGPERPSTAVARTRLDSSRPDPAPVAIAARLGVSRSRLAKQLAGDLDVIVMTALRKEPERRYQSVERMADDIRRHQDGLPVTARTDTFGYRTAKFVRRHWPAVAAALLIVASLLGGTSVALWQARVARLEARKATQLNDFVNGMLSAASPWQLGRSVTVAEVLDAASGRVDTQLSADPEIEAAIRTTLGTSYEGLGLFDAAQPQLERALAIRRQLLGHDDPEVATSLIRLADLRNQQGAFDEAEAAAREALAIRRTLYGESNGEVAAALNKLASVLLSKGSLDEAEQLRRQALAIYRSVDAPDTPEIGRTLNDLGVVLGTKGERGEAEQLHRQAIEIFRAAYGPRHPDVALAMSNLASLLAMDPSGYAEAETLFAEALEMRRELLGDDHPDVVWTTYNDAYLMLDERKFDESARLARQILALRGQTLADEHPMVASTLVVLGQSLLGLREATEAESALRESLAIRRQSLPSDHWLIASVESILGECLLAQGRVREAEPLLTGSYERLQQALGASHPSVAQARARLDALRADQDESIQ